MSTLEQDLEQERRRIEDLRVRAGRRLQETTAEAEKLQAARAAAVATGDPKGAADLDRRAQKRLAGRRRYEDLIAELTRPSDQLAAEVLLARLQGPELDLLHGEVERNRETIVQRVVEVLRARDEHRTLRQRWGELQEKIRTLRTSRGLPAARTAPLELRVTVTPATYAPGPQDPSFRDVAELIQKLSL